MPIRGGNSKLREFLHCGCLLCKLCGDFILNTFTTLCTYQALCVYFKHQSALDALEFFRGKRIIYKRSVNFEMSFWCHRFNQNSNKNIVRISALKYFPGDLVSNIFNKEAYRKPQKASRKPQGSYKNFQGRNPYNIFVAILVETMTPKRHFEIN